MKPHRAVLFSLLPVTLLLVAGETVCRLLDLPKEPSRLMVRVGYGGCYFKTSSDGNVTLCEPPGTPGERVQFRPHKQVGTCRVAFLGGSSVRIPGSPYRPWPERVGDLVPRTEILNLGIPGANSAATVLRGIEAANYDVDVFVVYTGHNDVAQGVFSGLRDPAVAASLRGIRLRMLLDRSALYRTVLSVVSPLKPVPRAGQLRMAVRTQPLYDEQARQTLARVLHDNLKRLVSAVSPKPVILVVPVSNPRWNPTGTLVPRDPDEASHLTRALETARAMLDSGHPHGAVSVLDATLATYPNSAYGWWLKAQALAQIGDETGAARAEGMARDLDAHPMRANTAIEGAVRQTHAYVVVDLPGRLPHDHGLITDDLFIDSIHFSDKGHAVVAHALAPIVSQACRDSGAGQPAAH